jgi:glycosidase
LGTKAEFKAMCDEAHKYGVKVIVDTVFNHLANGTTGNTLNSQTPSDIRGDSNCWHTVTTNISNYSNRYDITHNCLDGLPDFILVHAQALAVTQCLYQEVYGLTQNHGNQNTCHNKQQGMIDTEVH